MVKDLKKCFIRVHTLADGDICFIRKDCIEAVMERNEESFYSYGSKPNHTCIEYSGRRVEVIESYATVMDMIFGEL